MYLRFVRHPTVFVTHLRIHKMYVQLYVRIKLYEMINKWHLKITLPNKYLLN